MAALRLPEKRYIVPRDFCADEDADLLVIYARMSQRWRFAQRFAEFAKIGYDSAAVAKFNNGIRWAEPWTRR